MAFEKIDPKLNLPEEEKKVLQFWRDQGIFKKSLQKGSPAGNFVFYEGPPTANGTPGIHHVEARSFKDLFNRYKTMRGFHVERKAGWDTHGLPVELQVEKELGISGKNQIENIVEGDKKASIEKFNELCKKSVWRYKDEWEKLTERMAYWVDMDDPYITYDPKYIESVWSIISEINKKGLLYKGHKIVPYCPRCGTALSSHEVAQGYQKIKEEAIYIKFRSKKDPTISFLVWTTTPWTLSGNAALAFGPKLKYVLVESEGEKYILAKNRAEKLFKEFKVIGEYSGQNIVEQFSTSGVDYEPLYSEGENFSEAGTEIYKLITADYVSDIDGTGIVHMAPAFGEDDFEHGHKQKNIKVLKTVSDKGEALAGAGKGKFVKSADADIKADLESRGLLFRKEMFEHDYPFCWRCDSPLLYMARDSWYIAMSKLRDELLANNAKINWNPSYLKEGRFGEWLANVNDWAISRDRYWGTPLPVWECDKCKEYKVIASLNEVNNVDPHKPFVDEVTFTCACGGTMKRTAEVMDVWLDSGTMPYSQYHYPFENKNKFEEQFPADFISEAVDQTRGWFYTMLAISTIISHTSSYKNVISLGHVLDDKGKKMSKSKGNIVLPDEMFEKYGADIIRYYFYSVNQPGEPKLFVEKEIVSLSRNLFLTLWNVFSFFMTYASIDKFEPTGNTKSDNILDIWILAKFNQLVKSVEKNLNQFDPYKPANEITEFVNELSTWYVRRSRRRFWKSENDTDKNAAYETLYYTLFNLIKILAPFTPMFAETIYQQLRFSTEPESVHLCQFSKATEIDENVIREMAQARLIVEAGLKLRAESGIKVRQPLGEISYNGDKLSDQLEKIIADEVNVKVVANNSLLNTAVSLDTEISPELKIEGLAREIIRNIQELRKKSGFNVEDRITLSYSTASSLLAETMEKFRDLIAKEVLAESFESEIEEADGSTEYHIDNETIKIKLIKI